MAVSNDALSEQLREELTCVVCFDRYTDPRTLPCHHSFCSECISRLPAELLDCGRFVVRCPACRQPFPMSEREGLPAAFQINKLLDLVDRQLKQTAGDQPSTCPAMCPAHSDRPKDIYCDHCQELVCLKCARELHGGHEYDRAEYLLTEHKQQIEASLRSMKERIDAVEQMLECFDTREREIRKQGETVQKEINDAHQRLMNQLQESRRKLSEEAFDALQEKLHLHSLEKASVEDALAELKSCYKYVEGELRSQSRYQLQASKKHLVKCINDARVNTTVSELRPTQEPNIEFVPNTRTLSACSHVGDIHSNISFTFPRLFRVENVHSNTTSLHQPTILKRQSLTRFAGDLNGPSGIAVTSDRQHVVVAECKDLHRVTVLSKTGKIVRRFGHNGSGPGKFNEPWGVAVSPDKHIFIANRYSSLQKFSLSSLYETSADVSGYGVAIHPSGKLFFTNKNTRDIEVFNDDLTPCYSFSQMEIIKKPHDLAIDSEGMIYMTDFLGGVVLKFTPEGNHLATIGSKGERSDQFELPLGICIDSSDIMYVTDPGKHQVLVFTTEGEFLESFGCSGNRTLDPRGVAVDKAGSVYVCDGSSGEILVSKLSESVIQ